MGRPLLDQLRLRCLKVLQEADQWEKVLLKPTDHPQFVTVSGLKGDIPWPIVLDPQTIDPSDSFQLLSISLTFVVGSMFGYKHVVVCKL